jgi:MSHA pilin protein MshA
MVIVILGILSAVALPKFVDLGSDARKAAMKAVEGSMRTANSIIYAKAAVGNTMSGAGGTSTSVNGVAIPTAYGFATTAENIVLAMDINTTTGDFAIDSTRQQLRHKGATTVGQTCAVTYTAATSAAAPGYALDTSGC